MQSQPCSTLSHLHWTLSFPWADIDGGTPLEPNWEQRASSWRNDRRGTAAWVLSLSEVPDQLSWQALQGAHEKAGLDPSFRTGPAYCRHRRYGNRPDLDQRFAAKITTDGSDDVSPIARGIRGFLDIVHVHPFVDGNARAACTWLAWSLVSGGCNVPDLEPLLRLPFVPANNRIPHVLQKGLS